MPVPEGVLDAATAASDAAFEPLPGTGRDANVPLIVGTAVTKRYGRRTVLDRADFIVQPGITGLLGANGAGKTTLLGLLLGLHRPDEGALSVFGLDPGRAGGTVRSRIGYAPEHHQLPPDVLAHDFVRHIAEVHGLPHREAIERASDALWWVELGEERFRPLGTLSVGQRQRVKLAMAIAHDPALILLDEPTDGLDPTQRESMLELIRRIGHHFGISVVLSSHLLDEVERTCDRVVMLSSGRVVAHGAIDEIRGDGRGMRIELATQFDAAAVGDLLTSRGWDVVVEGTRVTLEVAPDSGRTPARVALAARDAVADTGATLRRLQPRVATLEEAYLEVDRR
ncbi:MAG TPA: ABC transporter ATP-binding protein [Microthrixaceae bacterium]|nr:ABC transporter ATP-binding protein [Microthrixaceae bacterium]